MKNLFFAITAIVYVFSVNAQHLTIKHVKSFEFKELITKKEGTLLDVRTSYEFNSGHINDAIQINYYGFSFKQELLLLPKDKPVYIYCRTGYRSEKASKILIENGYDVYNLQDGIKDWKRNKYPTIKDSGE